MKKILIICLMLICGIYIFADSTPERPKDIPEDAKLKKWSASKVYWEYDGKDEYQKSISIDWYINGNLSHSYYYSEDRKYIITEYYHSNGKLERIYQKIDRDFLKENHKKMKESFSSPPLYVGKYYEYYENGNLKNDKCYTVIVNSNKGLESALCGTELAYDENGNEIKRTEHKRACEYGCEEASRQTVDQISAKIRKYKNKELLYRPVVGKISSISKLWSKKIEIKYNDEFPLEVEDEIFFLVDDERVILSCKENKNGIGTFIIKDDKLNKFSLIKEDMAPRYYKKNEIKNEVFLSKKIKPRSGDVVVIGGIEFVYIPAGELLLRSGWHGVPKYNIKKVGDSSFIKFEGFWMTKYEITLGDYLKYSYEMFKNFPDNEERAFTSRFPANVFYSGASDYTSWFSDKYGVDVRLPFIDEWEYAARGGTTTDFYWGDDKIDDYCWYKKNSGGKMHPVGMKKPNTFGLYDMIGNVWEWCIFDYVRGGSALSDINDLRYSERYSEKLQINRDYYSDKGLKSPYDYLIKEGSGFRLVISDLKTK